MFTRLLYWLRISFLNLLLVALLGLILRYKIAFSLPFIDQKHLLHAHSHFAFSGWIGQALMAFMIDYASRQKKVDLFPKYSWLLYLNLFAAYGMLFSFPFQGYGLFSISFSTLSIFNGWVFAILFWKELNSISKKTIVLNWFKAALLFNAISSLGAFSLAALMANKIIHQNWYLLSIYFFLHFQYNGWFFFACMGLFLEKVINSIPFNKKQHQIFWLYACSCVPAYFLSALWLPMPSWVYFMIVLSSLLQLYAWVLLLKQILPNMKDVYIQYYFPAKWLLLFVGIALTIKLLLQAASTIPSVSNLAFGFRPIVIAYLHLILLGGITLFLISNFLSAKLIELTKLLLTGITVFFLGIIFNEFLLMIQGISATVEQSVGFINELLFFAAAVLFTGMLLLNLGIKKST